MGAGIHSVPAHDQLFIQEKLGGHLKVGIKPKEKCSGKQELFSVLCCHHVYLHNGTVTCNFHLVPILLALKWRGKFLSGFDKLLLRILRAEPQSCFCQEGFSRARGIPGILWEAAAPPLPISHLTPLV